jgi:hypothetical protein
MREAEGFGHGRSRIRIRLQSETIKERKNRDGSNTTKPTGTLAAGKVEA